MGLEHSIAIESVSQSDVCAILRAGHEQMDAMIPDRARQEFSAEAVLRNDVKLLVARIDGVAVGCCAIVLKEDYSELKKMYVSPNARRKGVADQLLARSEEIVRENNVEIIKLESAAVLTAAHTLYARHGFSIGSAFGDHIEDPRSIFLQKQL